MNFYFIFGLPGTLIVFAQIAKMLKNSYPHAKNIAIIYDHPFLKDCDYHQFLGFFDTVHIIPRADFDKNIIKGFKKTIKCRNVIKSIKIEDNSVIFTFRSMEWFINLLLKHIKRTSKSSKIIFLDSKEKLKEIWKKKSIPKSLLNWFYALLFGGYFMYSYVNSKGVFVTRDYVQKLYDYVIYFSTFGNIDLNTSDNLDNITTLPYPVYKIDSNSKLGTKKIVIFFGDANYFEFLPELDKSFFYNKLNIVLNELRKKYLTNNIILYYKPHPLDKGEIMQGLDLTGFKIFEERLVAEMIYALYWDNIVAVYSASSFSCYFASKYGIPAYVLHKYCWSDNKLKEKMSRLFGDTFNPLFKEITTLEDICSIDSLKTNINASKIEEKWAMAIKNILEETR